MNIIKNGEYFKINACKYLPIMFLLIAFSCNYIIAFLISRYIKVTLVCEAPTALFLIHLIVITNR